MARERIEIEEELGALRELRRQVAPTSTFGDDNQEAIDAQINVIVNNMTKLAVLEEYEDGESYILCAALDALNWLREDDEAPSLSWEDLVEEPCLLYLLHSA